MKLEQVLFGLLLFLLAMNTAESNCEYSKSLDFYEAYHVLSPGYPELYTGENHCKWQITSSHNINMFCRIYLPESDGCTQDNVIIQFAGGNPERYCGKNEIIVLEGTNPTVTFDSPSSSQGGGFVCRLRAEEPFDEKNCRCGWKNEATVQSRIMNGTETDVNEYPMMAGFYDNAKKLIFCGGTIINRQYIVTAAHCMLDPNTPKWENMRVIIGEHDVTTGAETNATKIYSLRTCKSHPHYSYADGRQINDVAICSTEDVIDFDANVGPVCLPFRRKQDYFTDSTVTAVGWGVQVYLGDPSKTLQEVDLNVISLQECNEERPDVTDKEICTLTKDKDSCKGDSGGPVLWKNPATQNLVLVGITSYGIPCLEGVSHKIPSVNMHVGSYLDWILSETRGTQYCKLE